MGKARKRGMGRTKNCSYYKFNDCQDEILKKVVGEHIKPGVNLVWRDIANDPQIKAAFNEWDLLDLQLAKKLYSRWMRINELFTLEQINKAESTAVHEYLDKHEKDARCWSQVRDKNALRAVLRGVRGLEHSHDSIRRLVNIWLARRSTTEFNPAETREDRAQRRAVATAAAENKDPPKRSYTRWSQKVVEHQGQGTKESKKEIKGAVPSASLPASVERCSGRKAAVVANARLAGLFGEERAESRREKQEAKAKAKAILVDPLPEENEDGDGLASSPSSPAPVPRPVPVPVVPFDVQDNTLPDDVKAALAVEVGVFALANGAPYLSGDDVAAAACFDLT